MTPDGGIEQLSKQRTGKKCLPNCQCARHHVPEDRRRRISVAMKGRVVKPAGWRHTEEARQKIAAAAARPENSERIKRAWREGRLHAELRPYRKSAGYHNGVRMRCLNSEGVFARQLDAAGIAWVYEPRGFNTSKGRYHPDFYLPEFNIWVEIKGSRPEPKAFAKHQAFREEYGKCLVVVYQQELERKKY